MYFTEFYRKISQSLPLEMLEKESSGSALSRREPQKKYKLCRRSKLGFKHFPSPIPKEKSYLKYFQFSKDTFLVMERLQTLIDVTVIITY